MAKIKVVGGKIDENLNGTYFNNVTSQTIFKFGEFIITANLDGRTPIDYTNRLTTFNKPVTLESIGINSDQSELLYSKSTNTVLNLDNSNLNSFVRFGSAYDFFRVSIESIIKNYPGSLHINSNIIRGGNLTYYDFEYNELKNESIFKVPIEFIDNKFNLVYTSGTTEIVNDNLYGNLNGNYDKYVVWSNYDKATTFKIIEFTGSTPISQYLVFKTIGNPFSFNSGRTDGYFNYHIKPNSDIFETFRGKLKSYEQYILSERDANQNFKFVLTNPTLLDDGSISYVDSNMIWPCGDGYNLDIDSGNYQRFLEIVLTIASKYDSIKTDLIARFLTPTSLKGNDYTEDNKMTKLLRIFGWEFDQIRLFVDSLVNVNKITYDKKNNAPDQLIYNLGKTFGWEYFNLVNEDELVETIFTIDDSERNLNTELLPSEINIELWRRILMNTNYFWKNKGTREAIKSIFLIIGIPEPFINITEYVYSVNGKIDPNAETLNNITFPSTLPYDEEGYPIAPKQIPEFYFQISGDTDKGQTYMNVFRKAGFDLLKTVDNKKSWIQTGSTIRSHYSTQNYYQEDSRLILNTKEIDISLDTARGIEYDVFDYIKNTDYKLNSSGVTQQYVFANIMLNYDSIANEFTLPFTPEGDFEVRLNGILLSTPRINLSGTTNQDIDYVVAGNKFTLTNVPTESDNIIEVSYVYSGNTDQPISGINITYMTTKIIPTSNDGEVKITLPNALNGDIQLTIEGIALIKGTNSFVGDYIINPNNTNEIIIQNNEVASYLQSNPLIQVSYTNVIGSNDIGVKNEVYLIEDFKNNKLYYNDNSKMYAYTLDNKVINIADIKVLIDGITLAPEYDYVLNTNNKFQIFIRGNLRKGSIISLYYMAGNNINNSLIIDNGFGIGDISKLSFLEFIEIIQRKLINVRTRKVITNFSGGWYPTLLSIYIKYLKRSELNSDDPLHSNGYTFENLYPFLNKYNAFFQRFIDELLSATIILRKGGLLVRNTVFTKQKFQYRRGVYMGELTNYSNYNSSRFVSDSINHLGTDGAIFKKKKVSQTSDWTNDSVCVGNLCANFKIGEIVVSYPNTPIPSTPFNSEMIVNRLISNVNNTTNGGKLSSIGYEKYVVKTKDIIPNGYTIDFNISFTSKNHIVSGNTSSSSSDIRLYLNDEFLGNTFKYTNKKTSTNQNNVINNTPKITISDGDTLTIIIENSATRNSITPTGMVESSVLFKLENIVVKPNGNISNIYPPSSQTETLIP